MTWALIGGPHHGETGTGDIPEGYIFGGSGSELGVVYDRVFRNSDELYRWGEDVRDIRDGNRLIEQLESGEIQFALPPELAGFPMPSTEALRVGLNTILTMPDNEFAAAARDWVATYRARGLI